MSQINEPIAILSCSIIQGMCYLIKNYGLRNTGPRNRKFRDDKGQEYIVVTNIEHIKGKKFSSFINLTNAHDHHDHSRMYWALIDKVSN